MFNMQTSGYVALFIAVVASRLFTDKANKLLSAEEKIRLKEGGLKNLGYALIILLVLVGTFYAVLKNVEIDRRTLISGYFAGLLVFLFARIIFNQKRMVKIELNKDYQRFTNFAQIASFLGVAWFGYVFL